MPKQIEKHKDLEVLTLPTYRTWLAWLKRNHLQQEGVWIKFAKKRSQEKSISYEEAREGAIIFGWIDGLINGYSDTTYLRKFTQRRSRSQWSKINRAIAEQLIKDKKMKPSGLAEITAAKKDGRWEAAYDSPSTAEVPADLQKLLNKNKKAKTFFESLGSANRYAFLYRIQSVKREETRQRHLDKTIQMLTAGKVYHPELRKKKSMKKICLLRGINVGGKNIIKMAELRELLSSDKVPKAKRLGNLRTYIQSGNLVFDSGASDTELETFIAQRIKKQFKLDVPVLVRSAKHFSNALKSNPFKEYDISKLCFTFMAGSAARPKVNALTRVESGHDEVKVKKDVVFLYFANGASKTKLTNNFIEKHFATTATSRNWKTVNKLVEMANEA